MAPCCNHGQFCAHWFRAPDQPLFRSFWDIIAGRTKRECLYCKLKVPGHWAGRSNIFLSFLTLCWYLKFAIFALWILFGLFFGHPCTRWNESATLAGLDTSAENGGCGTGGPGSALTAAQCGGTAGCASATCVAAHCDNDPSTIGELCWWALYLLAEHIWLYTGYWAFEIRNELWQLLFILLQFAWFLRSWFNVRFGVAYAFAEASKVTITDEDGDVSVYGGWGFTIVGILCIAYAVAALHTVVFGLMTWMKRLEAPAPTHGLGPRAAAQAVQMDAPQTAGAPVAPAQPVEAPERP